MGNFDLDKLRKVEIEILNEIVRICDKYQFDYFLAEGTLLGAVRHKGFIPWDDDIDIAMPRSSYEKFINVCKQELNGLYFLDVFETNPWQWRQFAKVRKNGTVFDTLGIVNNNKIHKGIWVDIFPLDNVKKPSHVSQTIQAFLVKNLRKVIALKVEHMELSTIKRRLTANLIRFINVSHLSTLQNKLMKCWNNVDAKYFVNLGSTYSYKKQTIAKDKFYPIKKLEFENKLYNGPNDPDHILTRIYGDYMKLPPVEERVTHNPIRIEFSE